jgi:flagellar basal-body rod protein FlgC
VHISLIAHSPTGRAGFLVGLAGLAKQKGFVAYPGINTVNEMVTLISATRAYEANVAALNAARVMALKALEIGGNG